MPAPASPSRARSLLPGALLPGSLLAAILLAATVLAPGSAPAGAAAGPLAPAAPAAGLFDLPAQPLEGAPPFERFRDRPALVVLFQPHCPHCLVQFRELEGFAAAHPEIAVAAVSLHGRTPDLLAELRRARAGVPAYRGSPALLTALGDPEGTPRLFAVAPDGRIVGERRGLQGRAALEALAAAVTAAP
ncbi:TlpA family protein disulfide reductase [Rhodocista pekingensis]|uniref:TlpA family protein disulfide reductase n=1 Tax=Rhodocista pekingensis TaxID=201185 RepID=A0ABW2KUX0_9PROT